MQCNSIRHIMLTLLPEDLFTYPKAIPMHSYSFHKTSDNMSTKIRQTEKCIAKHITTEGYIMWFTLRSRCPKEKYALLFLFLSFTLQNDVLYGYVKVFAFVDSGTVDSRTKMSRSKIFDFVSFTLRSVCNGWWRVWMGENVFFHTSCMYLRCVWSILVGLNMLHRAWCWQHHGFSSQGVHCKCLLITAC